MIALTTLFSISDREWCRRTDKRDQRTRHTEQTLPPDLEDGGEVREPMGTKKPASSRRSGKRVTISGKRRLRHGSSSQPARKQSPGLYIMNYQGRAAEQPAAFSAGVNGG